MGIRDGSPVAASTASEGATIPIGLVVFASLSGADIASYSTAGLGNTGQRWDGWAICDGANGTPNLADKFLRANVGAAGATGGSDSSAHTHAIDHDHGSFTSGSEAAHTHGVTSNVSVNDHASHTHTYTQIVQHTHAVNINDPQHNHVVTSQTATTGSATSYEHGTLDTSSADAEATEVTGNRATGITATTDNPAGSVATGTTNGPSATLAHTVNNPAVTSDAGSSHSHSVDVPSIVAASGAASATENRPAYHELVPVMRVA